MTHIITLLSGGQDSTTCLHWAIKQWPSATHHALSFDYGQRHAIELTRATAIAQQARVDHRVVDLAALARLTSSALTDASKAVVLDGPDGLPSSFVPGRNLIFLAYALSWAGALKATGVVFGANEVDYSGYPDCRGPFVEAMQEASNTALEGVAAPKIFTPLLKRDKAGIVRLARTLGPQAWKALGLSWSCYTPQRGTILMHANRDLPRPCGLCPACVIRAKGFADAGEQDPAQETA